MRVLVTVNEGMGHLLPLVPTVRALVDRGHDVLVACPGPSVERLDLAGVQTRRFPFELGDVVVPDLPAGLSTDELVRFHASQRWPVAARVWVSELVAEAERWRPDVVIVEPVEHAGRVVAAALGISWVEHGWGFSLPDCVGSVGAAGLSDLYGEFGATAQPPRLRVDLGPPGLQADDVSPDVVRYRYRPWAPPAPALPDPASVLACW